MTIVMALLVLGFLIFIHELGHFLLAKWNNIGVLAFAIGFGPKIWKRKIGETTYSLGIIPLGGYVRMMGDDPYEILEESGGVWVDKEKIKDKSGIRSVIEGDDADGEVDPAIMSDRSRWFLTKGFWAKSSVVLAGPLFNIIFAYFGAFALLAIYGAPKGLDIPVLGEVTPTLPAAKAGLQAGDKILQIEGKPVKEWNEIATLIRGSEGREISIDFQRGEEIKTVMVTPNKDSTLPDEEPVFRIGIIASTSREPVSIGDSAIGAYNFCVSMTVTTLKGIKGMLTGQVSAKNIAGPIFIIGEAGRQAKKGFESALNFMVFLSLSLAILNLLPIPVLDGGHFLFFIIEAIKGSPLNIKALEFAHRIGALILFGLIIFAVGNDILRHF